MKRFCCLLIFFFSCIMASAQHPLPTHSYLEIYDVASRTHRVVKEFPFVIEAPNWTPDGKWLVVNKDGKLWKIAPDGSTDLMEIPTGDITQCNNDHVITADGKWIGLSSNDPANKRYNSYVYVVPFTGGQPRRITPDGPSYLHGISPDGKTAAYCAFRGPQMEQDVWTMPLNGGKETRLTDAPGLDDGPEYSPDGKHIWFNSVRTGRMQVWRMKANGKQQTQMTFDEDMNSWFPHISPDGQRVVYIAYHDYEVAPDSHIADLNVQLRMIPASGGEPEVLVDFFGGQGSLNVNSWSPDSRQFAYVSYRLSEEITAPTREMAVQLYSVRTLLGTPELFARNHSYVLKRLAQMGYTSVEAASYEDGRFFGLSPEAFRKCIEAAGLKILSSHTTRPLTPEELSSGDFTEALAWWDRCIAAHKAAGIPYLVMSWSQPLETKSQMETMAAYLDAIGAKCRKAGIRFGYHTHSHELRPVDGTTMLDVFASETKPENVFIQMDVYWAVMAGANPVEYMRKYPGRYELLHIKDQYEIGQSGMMDFDSIFKAFPQAGTKGFVVEMEQASTPNILKGLRESALYLRKESQKNKPWQEIAPTEIELNPVQMIDRDWLEVSAGKEGNMNLMTISWGTIGELWSMPVFIVYVSTSRYTHRFMEENDYFTVTHFPAAMKKKLGYLGSVSGRDEDKVAGAGLTVEFTELGNPIYAEADLAIECRKLYGQQFDANLLPAEQRAWYERTGIGIHYMYIGEILHVWKK